MTYRELLDLYKRNELEPDQKNQVEADIEKQESIGNYLYEKDDIPALTAILSEKGRTNEADSINSGQEHEFMRMVRQSIRRAFIKMGIIASAIALVILLLIQFVLPEIVSAFYYDPGKEVAENTNQMSLDMAVYTELLIPQYFRYNVSVKDLGYGNYDFCINQNYSYNGVFTNISGRIEQGRMIKYDANTLIPPTGNEFVYSVASDNPSLSMSELEAAGQVSISTTGFFTDNLSRLNALSDNNKYVAYVTLQRLMEYSPFISFIQDNSIIDAWCAVSTNWDSTASNMFYPGIIGFLYSPINSNVKWDKERYPDLMLYDYDLLSPNPNPYYNEINANLSSEDYMQRHFTSMLRYMSDQKKFLKMMDLDPDMFAKAADYVEENGLRIYGFAFVADKAQLLKLAEKDKVYRIYTQPLQ